MVKMIEVQTVLVPDLHDHTVSTPRFEVGQRKWVNPQYIMLVEPLIMIGARGLEHTGCVILMASGQCLVVYESADAVCTMINGAGRLH
jgi:hypothetical protein